MQKTLTIFLIFCCGIAGRAQEINGFWGGRLVMDPGGCFPVYNIEFQLQISGTRITGTSYHYSDTSNYVREEFIGVYDETSKIITIEEQKVEVFKIPADCIPCIKKYSLSFHTDGKEEQLRGSWSGKTMDGKATCPSGTIVLTRFNKPVFRPKVPPSLIEKRNELVKEIFVDTGTIRLSFYDNGHIDGDTISVFINNRSVVSNQRLSAKALEVFVHIDQLQQMQEVVMVGENMGSIPPNTALMMINTPDQRYQLFLTSDDKKNSMVRFIYRPGNVGKKN